MTDFNKNTIRFDQVPASKVQLPESSKQKKLFLDSDNQLKTIDYNGKISKLIADIESIKNTVKDVLPEELKQKLDSDLGILYQEVNGKADQNIELTLQYEPPKFVAELVKSDKPSVEVINTDSEIKLVISLPDIALVLSNYVKKEEIQLIMPKDGKDGKDGINGIDGINGRDGRDGKPGKDGKAGRDGRDGRPGKDATLPEFLIGEVSTGSIGQVSIRHEGSSVFFDFVLPESKKTLGGVGGSHFTLNGLKNKVNLVSGSGINIVTVGNDLIISGNQSSLESESSLVSISGSTLSDRKTDKFFTYDTSGNLVYMSTILGNKLFVYNSGKLVSISASGLYQSKSFTYDVSGNLISVGVI